MSRIVTRIEKVVVDVEVRGDKDLLKLATASVAADKGLDNLGKRRLGTLAGDLEKTSRAARSLDAGGRDIDRFSGRLGVLRDLLLTIGPAAVPMGAVLVPAVAGLAAQMGAFALAGGTALAAFQGVGDTLEAVNTAALEPTAENLEEARIAMGNLSPAAQSLVRELQAMRPALLDLRDAAAGGLFPGIERSLADLDDVLPRVEKVFAAVGDATGDVLADFGAGLSSGEGREFLRFLRTEVPGAVRDLGDIVGNLAGGMAELWMAFTPLNNDFSDWMLDAARSFEDWASGLSRTQGFEEFVAYIRENGPRVADALGAIGNAVLQIVEAMAPLGGPTLMALEAVADVIGSIAGSDAGPAIMATVTALTLLNRGMQGFQAVQKSAVYTKTTGSLRGMADALLYVESAQDRATRGTAAYAAAEQKRSAAIRGGIGTLGKGAGLMAGLAVASSGVADKFGLANTASMALMGTLGGPWGAAIGGAVGFAMDLASAQGEAAAKAEDLRATLDAQTGAITANTREMVANALEASGALRAARDLGMDLGSVTDAALGDPDALANVNAELDRFVALTTGGNARQLADTDMQALNKAATDVREAIGGQNEEVREAVGSHERLSEATAGSASSMSRTRNAAQELRNALTNLSAALDQRSDMRDYEAALDDFRSTLRKTGNAARLLNKDGTINISLPKGRELEASLDGIAAAAIQVADTLPPLRKARVLNQARADVIAAAKAMGMPKAAIRDLLRDLGLLDRQNAKPKVDAQTKTSQQRLDTTVAKLNELDRKVSRPSIDVNTGNAQGQIQSVESWLNSIQDEIVYVNVERRGRGVQEFSAGGGFVPKSGLPYADRWPYMLADGEGITTNRRGETDRFRDVISGINAGLSRGQIKGMLADGGFADQRRYEQRTYMRQTSSTHTVERVVEQLPRGRVVAEIRGMGRVEMRFRDIARAEIENAEIMSGEEGRAW